MSSQIPISTPQTAPPDPREVEVALELGQHRELVLEAMRTQDWSAVDALGDPDDEAATRARTRAGVAA